ncbi:MAG TPA: hypothetical protein DEG09_12520 [Marinilabiliaceae bacterium]|nr:hypothetical protein [Marinilabiliaceae bacterium]HBX89425.1 hypothetical protein [Marinilabiliaceae bacterium]
MSATCSSKRYGFGIVVLLVGLTLLLNNFGFLPDYIRNVIFRWPMILILIGVVNLINKEWVAATILLSIGVFFLLPAVLPGFSFHEIWRFWPVGIILVGLVIIGGSKGKIHKASGLGRIQSSDIIEEAAIFGSVISRIQSQNFKGGEIVSVFGGCEVYLTEAVLAPEGARLEIVSVFGGVKLIVPREWNIKIEASSVLGGYNDKRIPAGNSVDMSRTLVIEGVNVFGGTELISR